MRITQFTGFNTFYNTIFMDGFKIIKNIFDYHEKTKLLGRWCHVNVPNCNNHVIMKKIDFANLDNNICNYVKKSNSNSNSNNNSNSNSNNNSNNSNYKPQEYIDAFYH